jgi:hypothetical protein
MQLTRNVPYYMKLPYSEGSVFVLLVRTGGFARGVVARMSPGGRVLFGYFFGPRLPNAECVVVDDLAPLKAVLRVRFGDLGLINGEWQVRGRIPDWNRAEWAMPDFARRPPGLPARRVRYPDNDPNGLVREYPMIDDGSLGTDSLSGYGAVEIKLGMLLGRDAQDTSQ